MIIVKVQSDAGSIAQLQLSNKKEQALADCVPYCTSAKVLFCLLDYPDPDLILGPLFILQEMGPLVCLES